MIGHQNRSLEPGQLTVPQSPRLETNEYDGTGTVLVYRKYYTGTVKTRTAMHVGSRAILGVNKICQSVTRVRSTSEREPTIVPLSHFLLPPPRPTHI